MSAFPLFEGGNAVRFFLFVFLCPVRCLLSFFCRSSPLRVVFWKNFRERTFVFGWLCWSCVFWWVFANVFALFFGVSLPKLFGKILFLSGLVFFWVRSLFLRFFFCRRRRSRFLFLFFLFSRDSAQVVTGHPHTRTCFSGSFSFCVPPLLSFLPVLAVRPASWRFSGVPFWAPGVFGILLGPSEAFSWDARRQGFSCVALVLFFFSPFVLRPHLF